MYDFMIKEILNPENRILFSRRKKCLLFSRFASSSVQTGERRKGKEFFLSGYQTSIYNCSI